MRIATRAMVPPYRLEKPPVKSVAIVVPLSTRAQLTPDEEVSMRHLLHNLGSYDRYLIASEGLDLDFPGFGVKRFAKKYFGSASAHGKLLANPSFYRRFLDYEFIFFYHLDSLVLSDQLADWCAADLDYIGPPWICSDDTPWVDRPRVGNGGFTLLRVESALQVIVNRYRLEPSTYWLDKFTRCAPTWLVRIMGRIQTHLPHLKPLNRLLKEWLEMENPAPHGRNNDLFWSDSAVRYLPEFKVASLKQGLQFAFETAPQTCYEMNGCKMPFGCHAWARYDRKFWIPHLLNQDS